MKSISKDDALLMFIHFIKKIKSTANSAIPVLIGHNASMFDVPILLRSLSPEHINKLKELDFHFGDSLLLAKQILKEQHWKMLKLYKRYCSSPS